jgi:hypothetical protein
MSLWSGVVNHFFSMPSIRRLPAACPPLAAAACRPQFLWPAAPGSGAEELKRLGRGPIGSFGGTQEPRRGGAKSVADGRRWKRLGVRTDADGMEGGSEPAGRNDFFRRPDGVGASPLFCRKPVRARARPAPDFFSIFLDNPPEPVVEWRNSRQRPDLPVKAVHPHGRPEFGPNEFQPLPFSRRACVVPRRLSQIHVQLAP